MADARLGPRALIPMPPPPHTRYNPGFGMGEPGPMALKDPVANRGAAHALMGIWRQIKGF